MNGIEQENSHHQQETANKTDKSNYLIEAEREVEKYTLNTSFENKV